MKKIIYITFLISLLSLASCTKTEQEKMKEQENKINNLISKAQNLTFSNENKQAMAMIMNALGKYPENSSLLEAYAHTLLVEKMPKEALLYFEKASQANSKDLKLLLICAYENFNIQNYEKAEDYFCKYLEIKPDDVDVIYALADTYNKLSNPNKALNTYLKANNFLSASSDKCYEIASLFSSLGNNVQALVWLDKTLNYSNVNSSHEKALIAKLVLFLDRDSPDMDKAFETLYILDESFAGALDKSKYAYLRQDMLSYKQKMDKIRQDIIDNQKKQEQQKLEQKEQLKKQNIAKLEDDKKNQIDTYEEKNISNKEEDFSDDEAIDSEEQLQENQDIENEQEQDIVVKEESFSVQNNMQIQEIKKEEKEPKEEFQEQSGEKTNLNEKVEQEEVSSLKNEDKIVENNEFNEAKDLLEKELFKDSQNADLWLKLSQIYFDLGSYEQAEMRALHALELSASMIDDEYLKNYINISQKAFNLSTYINRLRELSAQRPNSVELNLALAYAFKNDVKSKQWSDFYFNKALQIMPSDDLRRQSVKDQIDNSF